MTTLALISELQETKKQLSTVTAERDAAQKRYDFLLEQLAKRFPQAHSSLSSRPAELNYLDAVDAMAAERDGMAAVIQTSREAFAALTLQRLYPAGPHRLAQCSLCHERAKLGQSDPKHSDTCPVSIARNALLDLDARMAGVVK